MEITLIPIAAIELDSRNPRIANAVEGLSSAPSEEFIELALGKASPADDDQSTSTTYSSLKASIRANGGLIQPVIVRPTGPGRYLVVEGNTRVAIFRELVREDEEKWRAIPAVVREGMTDLDEHAIRLQSHLVGPRPWRAYAKGKYLHHLYHEANWGITKLLDFCGGTARKREIEEYIQAYADMQQYYSDQLQAGQGYSQFSAFVELQKPGIKAAIIKAGNTLEDFAEWLAEGNINPLNSVRQLPRILANPAARKRFLDHDAREALKLLEQPNANSLIKDAPLEQLAAALASKLRTEPWDVVRPIMEDREGLKAQALIDCFEELSSLLKHMNIDLVRD